MRHFRRAVCVAVKPTNLPADTERHTTFCRRERIAPIFPAASRHEPARRRIPSPNWQLPPARPRLAVRPGLCAGPVGDGAVRVASWPLARPEQPGPGAADAGIDRRSAAGGGAVLGRHTPRRRSAYCRRWAKVASNNASIAPRRRRQRASARATERADAAGRTPGRDRGRTAPRPLRTAGAGRPGHHAPHRRRRRPRALRQPQAAADAARDRAGRTERPPRIARRAVRRRQHRRHRTRSSARCSA